MSKVIDLYPFACDHCDYEKTCQSDRDFEMTKRLHKKKCSKEGRVAEKSVHAKARQQALQFHRAHNGVKFDAYESEEYTGKTKKRDLEKNNQVARVSKCDRCEQIKANGQRWKIELPHRPPYYFCDECKPEMDLFVSKYKGVIY